MPTKMKKGHDSDSDAAQMRLSFVLGLFQFCLSILRRLCAKMYVTMSGKCLVILVTVCLFQDCVSPIFCEAKGAGNIQHGGHTVSYTLGNFLDLQRTDIFSFPVQTLIMFILTPLRVLTTKNSLQGLHLVCPFYIK